MDVNLQLVIFFSSKIYNAALQHTLFDNSVFFNCEMDGSNFAYSTFTWSIIKKCPINGCAFTGATFNHVSFQDAIIAHSNFELCKFQNTNFQNIDFSNLALKYTFFCNISMHDSILPFMQMPYTFGGMRYIFTTNDNIKIATTNKSRPLISVEEYKDMLPNLIAFFSGHNDYFPLANCYLANNQYAFAESANETGIVTSASLHDFRKLYFFCVQATQELNVSAINRHKLYNKINQLLTAVDLTRAEYLEFRHYFPMIKQLMFDNPHNKPTLMLSFHTNIDSDDFDNLGMLMRLLDELAEQCGVTLDSKHMEIRHNSPNIVDWLPVGNIDELLKLLQTTWNVVHPILSAAFQDAANVATVINGLYELHKYRQNKKNIDASSNIDQKNIKTSEESTKDLSSDRIETLKLRIDLLKQEQKWKDNKSSDIHFPNKKSEYIIEKFTKKVEKLKLAGICIDTLEIQLLDEQCDVLDHLYNSDIQSN
jgi:hypothetical protein